MAQVNVKTADVLLANPAPLGLMGFGMTTVLLNLSNAGYFATDSAVLAMGIFFGGIAQIIAGCLEFRKGNTFGMTAFLVRTILGKLGAALLVIPQTSWGKAFAFSTTSVGGVLGSVGNFHPAHVRWHAETQRMSHVRIRLSIHPVLHARSWLLRQRKRKSPEVRRIRGHHMRPECNVHIFRIGVE